MATHPGPCIASAMGSPLPSHQLSSRADSSDPQRFLYETRIGFGLAIRGTGETLGQKSSGNGETTSALKFASDDPKSLIREGSGYWRYIPTTTTSVSSLGMTTSSLRRLRTLARSVRLPPPDWLGNSMELRPSPALGRVDQSPETSVALSLLHGIARITVAFIWIWHGLIPKLLLSPRRRSHHAPPG